jgi:predicted peptidase
MTPLQSLIHPPSEHIAGPAPLILFLHGSGERGTDTALLKAYGPLRHVEEGRTLPAFIAAPQCPLDHFWEDVLDELDAWLDDVLSQHPIDPNRVLLTGFSMGGFGAWQWALRHPGRFAALMPVAGNGFGFRNYHLPADLRALAALPIWMIHSAGDEVVPVSGADEVHRALLKAGARFGYTRYPDAGHTETARLAFGDRAHYDWLLRQKRQEAL